MLTGVPEPALSEPAQQLIGVRSGGERGHYCTTTPRLEKIRYINQLLVNGQTFPRGERREDEGGEGEERVASSRHLIRRRRRKGGREINDHDHDEDNRDDDDDDDDDQHQHHHYDHDDDHDDHDEDEDEDKDKNKDKDKDDDDDEEDKDEEEEDKGEDLLTCLDTQSWSKLFKHTCPRVTALTRAFTAVLTSPITTNSSLR